MYNSVTSGDTVRLKATFKTFDGVYSDPDNITLTIYDISKNKISSSIDLDHNNRLSAGNYYYDYTIPNNYNSLIYEFSGILEGTKVTARKQLNILFAPTIP